MKISIGGPIGVGKTTVASAIAKRFELRHISAGMIFREMAIQKGLSLEEFSKLAESDDSFDHLVDGRQTELASEGSAVVDGRLSGRLIDGDITIWLTAPFNLRAERVAKRESIDLAQARKDMEIREKSEATRYKKIYNIDLYDLSHYDVVLNTALWSAEGVMQDKNFVVVLGEGIRRRRCNISHLEPSSETIKLKKATSDKEILKSLK
jgi:cytidylate kinase